VLGALAFVHARGLMHCDVKPENIVVKSYSRVEVRGWGGKGREGGKSGGRGREEKEERDDGSGDLLSLLSGHARGGHGELGLPRKPFGDFPYAPFSHAPFPSLRSHRLRGHKPPLCSLSFPSLRSNSSTSGPPASSATPPPPTSNPDPTGRPRSSWGQPIPGRSTSGASAAC
jgi:serine/threonine protein kinase